MSCVGRVDTQISHIDDTFRIDDNDDGDWQDGKAQTRVVVFSFFRLACASTFNIHLNVGGSDVLRNGNMCVCDSCVCEYVERRNSKKLRALLQLYAIYKYDRNVNAR